MTKSLTIGKKKYNYLIKIISYARENNCSTLDQLEVLILQSREIHVSKLKRSKKPKIQYDSYIKSNEWFSLREKYIEKYGDSCQVCETKKGNHLHHMTYKRLGKEKDTDLIFLCAECHYQVHHGENNTKTTLPKQMLQNIYWWRSKLGFNKINTFQFLSDQSQKKEFADYINSIKPHDTTTDVSLSD